MKKKCVCFVLVCMVLVVFTAPVFAKTTMKMAFNQDNTHPQYIAMEQFGKKLAERTGASTPSKFIQASCWAPRKRRWR